MVKALEDAMKKAEALSAGDQETLAAIIEAEMADEEKWQARFKETPEVLAALVERAKRQYSNGETRDL